MILIYHGSRASDRVPPFEDNELKKDLMVPLTQVPGICSRRILLFEPGSIRPMRIMGKKGSLRHGPRGWREREREREREEESSI